LARPSGLAADAASVNAALVLFHFLDDLRKVSWAGIPHRFLPDAAKAFAFIYFSESGLKRFRRG
jgi:hypothetical protein